jgi:YfiH family protein
MTRPRHAAWIRPSWPAPAGVCGATTTREHGASRGAYAGFNLADHVGDAPRAVAQNRSRLRAALELKNEPLWLSQVHGTECVPVEDAVPGIQADASVSTTPGLVCAVLTADCLPVLFCDRAGTRVGAAHAGWRGLAGGVLEATVAALDAAPGELMAWLGPAIGPECFEVGPEVREAFVAEDPAAAVCFRAGAGDRFLADLYALARRRLRAVDVVDCYGGEFCTYTDAERFYSYRRDGRCGRMATLVWLGAGT